MLIFAAYGKEQNHINRIMLLVLGFLGMIINFLFIIDFTSYPSEFIVREKFKIAKLNLSSQYLDFLFYLLYGIIYNLDISEKENILLVAKIVYIIINLGYTYFKRQYSNSDLQSISLTFAFVDLVIIFLTFFSKISGSDKLISSFPTIFFIMIPIFLKISQNLIYYQLNKLLSNDFSDFKTSSDIMVVFDYLFSMKRIFQKKYLELNKRERKKWLKIRSFLNIHKKNHSSCKIFKKMFSNKYEFLMNEILENGLKKHSSNFIMYQYLLFNINSIDKYPGYTYLKIKKSFINRKAEETSISYRYIMQTMENVLKNKYDKKSLEIEGDPWHKLEFIEKMKYVKEKMLELKDQIISFYAAYKKSKYSMKEISNILLKITLKKEKLNLFFEKLLLEYNQSSYLLVLRINYLIYLDNYESEAQILMSKKLGIDEFWKIMHKRILDSPEKKSWYLNFSPTSGVIMISGEKNKMALLEEVSRKAEVILGYKSEELKGKPIEILQPKSMQNYHEQRIKHCIEIGHFSIFGILSEFFIIDKEGFAVPIFFVSKCNPSLCRGLTFLGLIDKSLTENEYILTNDDGEVEGMSRGISKFILENITRGKQVKSIFHICPELKGVYMLYDSKAKEPKLKKKNNYFKSSLAYIDDVDNQNFDDIILPFMKYRKEISSTLTGSFLFSQNELLEIKNHIQDFVYLKFKLKSYVSIFGKELYRYLEFQPNYIQTERKRDYKFSEDSLSFEEEIKTEDKMNFNYLVHNKELENITQKSVESLVDPKETFRNSEKSLINIKSSTQTINSYISENREINLETNEAKLNMSSQISVQVHKKKKKIEKNMRKPYNVFNSFMFIFIEVLQFTLCIIISLYCHQKIGDIYDKQFNLLSNADRYLRLNNLNSLSMLATRNLDLMGRGLHEKNFSMSSSYTTKSFTNFRINLYVDLYPRYLRESLQTLEETPNDIKIKLISLRFYIPEPFNIKIVYGKQVEKLLKILQLPLEKIKDSYEMTYLETYINNEIITRTFEYSKLEEVLLNII